MASVLIAEADEVTRQRVVSFLQSAGHSTVACSDGDSVLDSLSSETIDVIVTDLELPGSGGLELLCRVRVSHPEIKVLLTAEKPTFESAAEAVRTGAFDFLVKPVTREAICRAVGSAERIKALEDENRNYRNQLEGLVRDRTRQIREYSDRLRLVADRTRRLTACRSLEELGLELLNLLSASLGADGGSFYVVRDGSLQLIHALDPGHQRVTIPLPPPPNSVLARVFERKRGILVEGIQDTSEEFQSSGWNGYRDGSLLALPFFSSNGEIQGAIGLHNKRLPPFTPQDLEVGQIIVFHGVEALRNILLADRVRKSEDRYRTISERSLTGIIVHEQGVLRYVNSRLLSMLEYGADDRALLIGRPVLDFVHAEDRDRTAETIRRRVQGDSAPQEYSIRLVTRTGRTIWVEVLVSSIQADSGSIQFLVHIIDSTDRRRAEIEWRKLTALIENSTEAIGLASMDGSLRYLNRAGQRLLEIESERLMEGSVLLSEFLSGMNGLLSANHFGNPDRHGTFNGEASVQLCSGRRLEVFVNSFMVQPIDSGDEPALAFVMRDETQRKQTIEALRRSEETFRALAENSLDIVFRLDHEGTVLYVNPAVEAPIGLPPEKVIGRNLHSMALPEDLSRPLLEAVHHVFGHGTLSRFELQTLDGNWFDCMLMPEFSEAMEVKAVIGSARDITESKISQEIELQRLRRMQRQQILVKDLATHPAVAAGDFETVVRIVTESVSFALEVDQVTVWTLGSGGDSLDCVDRFDRSTASHGLASSRVLTGRDEYLEALHSARAIEVSNVRSDSRTAGLAEIWPDTARVRSLLHSAIRMGGKVVGALSHEQTLTNRNWLPEEVSLAAEVADQLSQTLLNRERHRAEQEKAELEEQLRQSQKMEAIGRLAGGVAHDFNNLLTAIQGYSEIVLNATRSNDPLRTDILEIRKAADRATALTQQLLAFSRKQSIEPRVMDLNESVLDSRAMLERVIGEDIELVFDLCTAPPRILADPHQIDQVLLNLVANARDAMPDGGRLKISTTEIQGRVEEGKVLSDPRGDGIIVLTLQDSGDGIDEATQKRIFEPFFTTKEKGKGTGLGLATVYGIVQQNNGAITVRSEKSRGTTFEICFARTSCEPAPAEPSKTESTYAQGRGTVLLVEDELAVRSLTRKVLSAAGYSVLEAGGGREALELSGGYDGGIDLLLTDVVMPQLNGKELHRQLIESRPDLKVLFMSGYTEDVISTRGVIDAGLPFIQKPFSIDAICKKVAEVLS